MAGASLGAPNPSTDPLVAAQYAPVRDAPPADDERRQLMDNKEWFVWRYIFHFVDCLTIF